MVFEAPEVRRIMAVGPAPSDQDLIADLLRQAGAVADDPIGELLVGASLSTGGDAIGNVLLASLQSDGASGNR